RTQQARSERILILAGCRAPVVKSMDPNGDAEEHRGRLGNPATGLDPTAEQQPGDEGGDSSDRSDPRGERGATCRQAGSEVPGEGELQRDPGAERDRKHEQTEQSG